MSLLNISYVFFTQVVVTTAAPTTTPPIKTFTFYKLRVEWVEAVQHCTSKGLRLAVISSVSELQRAQALVKRVDEPVWLAGNDISFEGHWKWANGSLDDWSSFINAGGALGLEFNWKDGTPHRRDDEDCLFMNDDGEFDDNECNKDNKYILCDDGTD